MCHVTKYCNVIGPHYTVWWDTVCSRSLADPSLFAEVGLACKANTRHTTVTNYLNHMTFLGEADSYAQD